ncbi:MAG: ATP-binding protein, partial [bacterium]|nr:ATP-binding protein [bacterium]
HLVAVAGDGEPLSMRSLRVDDRIAGFLLGRDEIDGRLREVVSASRGAASWDQLVITDEELERLKSLAAAWAGRRQSEPEAGLTLLLHGPYGSGRLATARALAAASGTPLLVAGVEPGLAACDGWDRIVELAYREARLRGAALCWTGCEKLLANEPLSSRWDRLMSAAEDFRGLTLLASEIPWDPAGRFLRAPYLRIDLPVPAYRYRVRLWDKHLPAAGAFASPVPERARLTEALANGFQLTGGQMADAVATARGLAARRDPLRPRLAVDDLYDGCRRQSGRRLLNFARRLEPRTELSFDHLILPAPNKRQLGELRDRIRHRNRVVSELGFERRLLLGKGLIVLFTGSSGTGKTMSAELLAREQRVDLYKVDLSAVVSKYVGETEKNLSRVFAEAEDANAILFFDEADAIFGKRGEVKDARDRWANLEVNYLLQKVEEYAGVVILASNLRQNIDEAFLRRIQVIVEFPFPDAAARLRIWQGMFPDGIERPPEAEIRALAERFKLPGGSIKNIVVDAAFRALAEEGGRKPSIALRHLVLGTGREYQKLGKPTTRSEFGEEFHEWLQQGLM